MKTVRFSYDPRLGYRCSEPGDMAGKYLFIGADADEPLTEDWLKAVGFEQLEEEEAELSMELLEGNGYLEVIPFDDICQWWLYGHEFYPAPTSRGEVRILCWALGIDLNRASLPGQDGGAK